MGVRSESIGGVVDIVVDGVCEPIAQWRVSASEPKAREREKVEKDSLGGVVDIVVDGVRTNCVANVWMMVSWCKLCAVMARCAWDLSSGGVGGGARAR